MPIRSGPSCMGLVNRPFQAMKTGRLGRARRTATGSRASSGGWCATRRARAAADPRGSARRIDGPEQSESRRGPAWGEDAAVQAGRNLPAGRPPGSAGGRRGLPAAGCRPRRSRRPVLDAASPATSSRMTVRLASAFAAKIRRGERTATSRWRQVPSRSSNRTRRGNHRGEQRERQGAREAEHHQRAGPPGGVVQRPEEGVGGECALLSAATNSAGAIQQARTSSRIRHCETS